MERRLKALYMLFALSVCSIGILIASVGFHASVHPYVVTVALCTMFIAHTLIAFTLSQIATAVGRGGVSVFVANLMITPLLTPISCVRACFWARRHITEIERQKQYGEKASRELGLDGMGSLRVTRDDRI
jgi:hypothetical protein